MKDVRRWAAPCALALAGLLTQACRAGSSGPATTKVSTAARDTPRPATPAPSEAGTMPDAAAPAPTQSAEPPTAAAAPSVDGTFDWELGASPTRLTMAQRPRFRLVVRATNRGTQPGAPLIHAGQLTVNGERSFAFDLAFGNGAMERGWLELPPNESVETSRGLGEALFPAPGDYALVFTNGDSRSAVTIRVVP